MCASSEGQRPLRWMEAVKETAMKDHIETYSTPVLDPRELHIEQIFSPNRFDVLTILKALNVSIRSHSCLLAFFFTVIIIIIILIQHLYIALKSCKGYGGAGEDTEALVIRTGDIDC